MTVHPLAGKPAPPDLLVDLDRLRAEYSSRTPDAADRAQRVSFGTSGHRGTSLRGSFNEAHVLAITQAICDYRRGRGIGGPLCYNPPSGGPADTDVTRWIEDRANRLLSGHLREVKRIAYDTARPAAATWRRWRRWRPRRFCARPGGTEAAVRQRRRSLQAVACVRAPARIDRARVRQPVHDGQADHLQLPRVPVADSQALVPVHRPRQPARARPKIANWTWPY